MEFTNSFLVRVNQICEDLFVVNINSEKSHIPTDNTDIISNDGVKWCLMFVLTWML